MAGFVGIRSFGELLHSFRYRLGSDPGVPDLAVAMVDDVHLAGAPATGTPRPLGVAPHHVEVKVAEQIAVRCPLTGAGIRHPPHQPSGH